MKKCPGLILALMLLLVPLIGQELTIGPANGDFESNLSYWTVDAGNTPLISTDSYSGSKACRVRGFSVLASLVQNGGFESNWTYWPVKNGTYAISTPARSGSKACRLSGFSYGANIVTNGGFESNWTAWPDKVGNYVLSTVRRSGSYSCQLTGQVAAESSVTSSTYAIQAGGTYNLTSYVRYQSGTGNYKVTIAWLNGAGGVISYANDWKGTNKPASFTFHGGTFQAPANAVSARIILGVSANTSFMFDDVALQSYQTNESSVFSAIYAAQAGKSYQLNSYVKYVSGNGNYKVTIAWLNASGGVIAYANDWQGTNRPASYAYHGGWFTAPANTAQVRVILGAAATSEYLFDDIELIPQGTLAAASISSSMIAGIVPGQLYKLSGYVKYLLGTGKYKIAIGWYDVNHNLIRYDNDWAGTDKPTSYTRHGYSLYLGLSGADGFLPPDNAENAVIFFGVEAGVEALFDKITLTTADSPEELFLQNEFIKVGVSRKYGGAITYLAGINDLGRNYVNFKDAGKLIQRSYWGLLYSDEPKILDYFPWGPDWNPVQGGSQKLNSNNQPNTPGGGTIRMAANKIYTECYPLSWNLYKRTLTQMKTEISLIPGSRVVKIVTDFKNRDPRPRAQLRDQEMICAYVTPDLKWFKAYHGAAPFTSAPLAANPDILPLEDIPPDHQVVHHNFVPEEYWGAWVNDNDFGVGIFSPDLKNYKDQGKTINADAWRMGDENHVQNYNNPNPEGSDVNYVALLPQFEIQENMNLTETTYVILDTVDNIRSFVYEMLGYTFIPQ